MRPVHAQITSGFIHFVFHEVKGADFNKGVYNTRRVRAYFQAVPGVWAPTIKRVWK